MNGGPPRLTRLLALQVAFSIVASAGASTLASSLKLPPIAVTLLGAAFGLGVFGLTVGRTLSRVRRTLEALTDGVRGYAESDFSLRLAPPATGELTELVALYNSMGEALRRSRGDLLARELLLDTVLQSAPMSLLLVDERGRVVFANLAARTLLSKAGALEGRSLAETSQGLPEPLAAALVSGRDGLVVAGGAPDEVLAGDTFRVAFRELRLHTRSVTLVLVERITQELRRQEVAVWKRVIRVMSHELNNSLAPASSLVHSARALLARGETARAEGLLGTVDERLSSLSGFLEGYARFARLPLPRKESVPFPELLDSLEPLVPFRRDLPADLPPAALDRAQMQQVLLNLLKNAVEAGSPPGETVVRAREAEGLLTVEVLDRGSGLEGEDLSRVLLPFHSTKPGGSGLGLPLCREIVEAHGGALTLMSRAGGGLVVRLVVPIS
ncbi:MAG: ATP-binding protein [Acidobacteria bacterium]|nr:ATP-binding protein [Acidobacteriota bacterium]